MEALTTLVLRQSIAIDYEGIHTCIFQASSPVIHSVYTRQSFSDVLYTRRGTNSSMSRNKGWLRSHAMHSNGSRQYRYTGCFVGCVVDTSTARQRGLLGRSSARPRSSFAVENERQSLVLIYKIHVANKVRIKWGMDSQSVTIERHLWLAC